MLSASIEFRNKIANNSKVSVKATLKLRNGQSVELTGDDIIMSGLSFTEATSSSGAFDIGGTVIGKCDCTLNNFDGRFDDYDFTNAVLIPYVGMPLDAGGTEWIRKGTYNVQQPDSYGATITLSCFDNLSKMDVPVSEVKLSATGEALSYIQEIVQHCGLTLATSTFNNYELPIRISTSTDLSNVTCRQALSYILQCTCNYAKCDPNGRVVIGWYDKEAFAHEQTLDGKWFDDATPYASGDTADGGNFTNYSSGASYEGGEFRNNFDYATISAMSTQTIGLDDVIITGIQVTSTENPDDEADDDHQYDVALYGAEGYVLEIKDNPFIPYGFATFYAEAIAEHIVGLRFRIFNVQALGTPVIEAGDAVLVIDGQQRQYHSYLTQVTYKPGAYETYTCSGETPARRSAMTTGPLGTAVRQFTDKIKKEKTAREKAQEDLANRLAESSGFYMTAEEQDDDSTIYYAHDKPTLEGSKIVWKITAEAIGFSTDGGKSYPYGFDVDGNTILNRIYTIGLDASYITAGTIRAQKGGNFWNLETGELRMAAESITDANGKTLKSILDALEQADADNYNELKEMVSDGQITEAEKASIDVMLKRIEAEQAEAINLYNTVYGNSNLTGTAKTNLYNAKVALYGSNNTSGSYGTLVTAINTVKNATTPSAVESAMSTYETRYASYKSNRNTFTSALQAAQLAIDTNIAAAKAKAAVDAQTQEEIFNKLTNGGKDQGVYLQNGLLYINATYIQSGTISGSRVRTGVIEAADSLSNWNLNTGVFQTHAYVASPQAHNLYMKYEGYRLSFVMDSTTLGKLYLSSSHNNDPNHHLCIFQANEMGLSSASNIRVGYGGGSSTSTTVYDSVYGHSQRFLTDVAISGTQVTIKARTYYIRHGILTDEQNEYDRAIFYSA